MNDAKVLVDPGTHVLEFSKRLVVFGDARSHAAYLFRLGVQRVFGELHPAQYFLGCTLMDLEVYGIGLEVFGAQVRVLGHILAKLVRVLFYLLERAVVAVEYPVYEQQYQRDAYGDDVAEVEHVLFLPCWIPTGKTGGRALPDRPSI